MHIRGPHPNGKNETWPLVAFETPSANLSGLKSFASSPQSSWSWWTRIAGMETWTPAGKIKFPSFISSWTIRLRTIIGGYSLKTSYKIMVTCDMEYIYIVRIRKWCAYQTHLIKYLIEVMPMQKYWLQWSPFFFFLGKNSSKSMVEYLNYSFGYLLQ